MNRQLTLFFFFLAMALGAQAQKSGEYYVKHIEFPQNATIEQKVDKKTQHSSIPRNWMPNNGCAASKKPALRWCF